MLTLIGAGWASDAISIFLLALVGMSLPCLNDAKGSRRAATHDTSVGSVTRHEIVEPIWGIPPARDITDREEQEGG